jgi:hypothetical protein
MAGRLTVSTLNDDTGVLATQNGMSGIAKAWVNFNGSTAAIRGSFNVSSVTRTATGTYTINFTTAMPDTNYSVALMCPAQSNSDLFRWMMVQASGGSGVPTGYNTTSVAIIHGYQSVISDCNAGYVAVYR